MIGSASVGATSSSPRLDYDAWAEGLRDGRAYVTDGRSHLIDFRVDDRQMGTGGSELRLDAARPVRVTAQVAARLEPEVNEVVRGLRRDEKPYWDLERARIGSTRDVPVDVIVNGRVAARRHVLADGRVHDLAFEVPLERSSWIALRILPSSHTNPIFVVVGGQPIRASRASAEWCLKAVDQCWLQKAPKIAEGERGDAEQAYAHARRVYQERLKETPEQ